MILVTGVAGSGKSTQCQKLEALGSFQWLSVGELLRHSQDQSIHEVVNQGNVIDDDITINLVHNELQQRKDTPEVLLDGFPRTSRQADWLLSKHKTGKPFEISAIIHLTLSEAVALERLHARGRRDDYDAAIAKRFEVYEDVVVPIVSRFETAGLRVIEVGGAGSEDQVFQIIRGELGV